MRQQTLTSCPCRSLSGILVFALLVAGLIGEVRAQFTQAAPKGEASKQRRNDLPEPAQWKRPYAAPNDSLVVLEIAVPLTTIREAMIEAIAKEKKQKALPVVVSEDPGKPRTIQTVIKEPVTSQVPRMIDEKVTRHIPAQFRNVLVPRVARGPFGVPIPLPPLPVPQLIPGTGIDVTDTIQRQVFDPVTKLVERTTEVEVQFSHCATLRSVELTMMGNTVTCAAKLGFSLNGKILRTGIVPAGPTTTVNGAMAVRVSKVISWNENGQLVFTAGETKASIDPLSSLTSFPSIDPYTILPVNLMLDLLGRVMNDELGKIATSKLPGLPDVAANKLTEAQEIKGIGRLVLNPQEVYLYPVTGDGKTIRTTAALRCHPVLLSEHSHVPPGKHPQAETLVEKPFSAIKYTPKTEHPPAPDFHLELECTLDTNWIGNRLTAQKVGILFPKGRVSLVPAGEDTALIQVPVETARMKRYFKTVPGLDLLVAMLPIPDTFSVWGKIGFTEQDVLLENAKSQPAFLMKAINISRPAVPKEGPPEKRGDNAKGRSLVVFSLPPKDDLSQKLNVGIGDLSLSVTKHRIAEIYLTPDQLKVVIVIDGNTELSVPAAASSK